MSGYLVMKEYWGDPARSAEVLVRDDEGKLWMRVSPHCVFVTGYLS